MDFSPGAWGSPQQAARCGTPRALLARLATPPKNAFLVLIEFLLFEL